MFDIFSQLNHSIIFNSLITVSLYSIILIPVFCVLIGGISQCCKEYHQRIDRLNSIPTMTKKQLIQLARDYGIKYSRMNKYQLANYLIMKLV